MFETQNMLNEAFEKHVLEWQEFRPGYDMRDLKDEPSRQYLAGMQDMADLLIEKLVNDMGNTATLPETMKKMVEELYVEAADELNGYAFGEIYDNAIAAIEGQGE